MRDEMRIKEQLAFPTMMLKLKNEAALALEASSLAPVSQVLTTFTPFCRASKHREYIYWQYRGMLIRSWQINLADHNVQAAKNVDKLPGARNSLLPVSMYSASITLPALSLWSTYRCWSLFALVCFHVCSCCSNITVCIPAYWNALCI